MRSIGRRIPLTITPAFFIVAALIGYLYSRSFIGTLLWMAVIFVSVLFHEFGHALTALLFGQSVKIDLVGFGGLTHHDGKILKPWQNFLVVLNGPMAGFCLFLIAWAIIKLVPHQGFAAYFLEVMIFVNLFWTIINLLPIQPLDGGKLLNIVFEKLFGYKGVRYSYLFSAVLAVGISLAFFIWGAIIAGAIFFLFAFESFRGWKELENITALDRDAKMQEMLKKAQESLDTGNYAEAEADLEEIVRQTEKGVIYQTAAEFLGKIYFSRGEKEKAFDLLYPLRRSLSPQLLLILHQISGDLQKWDIAASIGEKSYTASPNYKSALINASANAYKGQEEAAAGWLSRAVSDGAPNIQKYIERPEFDALRENIRKRLRL